MDTEGALVPAALVAVADTSYATPLVSPRIEQNVGPALLHVCVAWPAAIAEAA